MFNAKSFRVFFAMAALSLAACGTTQKEYTESVKKRSVETFHIICKQSDSIVLDAKAVTVYEYAGSVNGVLEDGSQFFVSGSACTWKAIK